MASGGGNLGSNVVEFTTKGIEVVKQGMEAVKAGLDNIEKATQNVAAKVAASPAAIGAAVAGFQMLTAAARGWVNAGLAGTGAGNLMQFQFQMLSREIASVFLPTINMVIRAIEAMVNWFRSLSGDQQAMIRHFVEAAAVMVVVNQVLGRVTTTVIGFVATLIGGMVAAAGSIVTTLVPAFLTLVGEVLAGSVTIASALGFATAGISTILGLVGALASAFLSLGIAGATLGAGVAVGTASGRSALKDLWDSLKPVLEAFKAAGSQIMTALGPVLDTLGGSVGDLLGRIAGVVTNLATAAGPVLTRIAELAGQVADKLADMLDSIDVSPLQALGELAGRVAGFLVEVFAGILPVLAQVGSAIGRYISAAIPIWMQFGQIAMQVFRNLWPAIRETGNIIGIVVSALMDTATAIGSVVMPVVMAIAAQFAEWQSILAPAAEVIWKILTALFRLQAAIVGIVRDAGLQILKSMFGDAFGGASGIIQGVTDGLKGLSEWLVRNLPGAVETFVHAMGNGLMTIVDMLIGLKAALQDIVRVFDAIGGTHLARDLSTSIGALGNVANALRSFRLELGIGETTTRARAQRPGEQRQDITPQGGQFEQAMDLFKRINTAAAQQDIPRRQLDVLERIEGNTRPTNDALDIPVIMPPGQERPAFA